MPLEPLRILKNWYTNLVTREVCWDEIADKVTAWTGRADNNFKQIGLDIGGSSYDYNNNGRSTLTTSINSRLSVVESTLAATVYDNSSNMSLDLTAGVLKITGTAGADLASDNPGTSRVPKTDYSGVTELTIVSSLTLNDDSHATSHLTNTGWGITETAHWANDMPFFLYVVNRLNSNVTGIDGDSSIFISRHPWLSKTPSAVGKIGDHVTAPTTDGLDTIILMGTYTHASYTSLPCQMIGAIRMRWSTTSDDWTVQALAANDGIGSGYIEKTFGTKWSYPMGQNGASAGSYLTPNGGTAPKWDNETYSYFIGRNGLIYCNIFFNDDGGGDGANGAGNVNSQLTLPFTFAGWTSAGPIYWRDDTFEGFVTLRGSAATGISVNLYQGVSTTKIDNDDIAAAGSDKQVIGSFSYLSYGTI